MIVFEIKFCEKVVKLLFSFDLISRPADQLENSGHRDM